MSNGLDILRLVHSPVELVMLPWFNVDNPLWLRQFVNPRYKEVAAACTHDLPSWAVCWASPHVRFPDDGVLSLQAVFVDTICNLSAFNILEADESYPRNIPSAASIPNAYSDLAGLKEAFWRTIIANSTSTGDEPPLSWRLLIEQRRWGRYGTSEMVGSGINFGLHSFALRNLKLLLPGGYPLGDLLGYKGPHQAWGGNKKSDVVEQHSELDERDAVSWASNALAWRRLAVTGSGRLALTVAAVLDGDTVVVLPGCSTPVVIRYVDSGWKLIGEIFVYGLMNGETATMVRDGLLEVHKEGDQERIEVTWSYLASSRSTLLQRQGDESFTPTKDLIDNIPPYAILSRTWGEDDEEVVLSCWR
ncbi:hypothetical protein CHU98_g6339 [Xylaria longipes]|nr:hypothetical protein CHU98_g6339 [Xylaria longipes]